MLTFEKHLASESELLSLAAAVARASNAGTVIYLDGPLGAGKTTFTRGFLRGLGYTQKVKSPTYTLVEPYEIDNAQVFHFDLYRIEDPQELAFIGIQDYFSAQARCLIEWPEKGFPLLPPPDLTCKISIMDHARAITIIASSPLGEDCLKQLLP